MHWCNNANSSKIDRAAFFFYEVTKELLSVLHRSPQTKHSTNSLSITEGDCEDYSRSSNLKKEKKTEEISNCGCFPQKTRGSKVCQISLNIETQCFLLFLMHDYTM